MKQYKQILTKILKSFFRLNKEQRQLTIYVILLSFLILFFPLIHITIINVGSDTAQTKTIGLYLRNNNFLIKSCIVILIALGVLIARNSSKKIKDLIVLIFGFKENPFLLNFGLLRTMLAVYLGIGEGTSVAKDLTTRISLTNTYYIILFMLLAGLIFTLYLTLQQAKKSKKNINIYTKGDSLEQIKKQSSDNSSLQSLFKEKE